MPSVASKFCGDDYSAYTYSFIDYEYNSCDHDHYGGENYYSKGEYEAGIHG